jgi:hypothetical protein
MMSKSPADRYASPAQVASALAPFTSGPGPLGRLMAAETGQQGTASEALEVAVVAEWFEFDLGPAAVVASTEADADASPVAAPGEQDVFPRIDFDRDFVPRTAPLEGSSRRAKVWTAAVVLALLFLGILAIALAFLE